MLLGAAVLVGSIVGSTPTAAHAEGPTKRVGVAITKVRCTSPCDAEGLESDGEATPDFYALVFFDGREHRTRRAADDQSEINPEDWVVTENLPLSDTHLNVTIQIWDHDIFTSGDDLADDAPSTGDRNLEFRVDLRTGAYTGDISLPAVCAAGNGDSDGDVEVCFEMILPPAPDLDGDEDGDGLTDAQEIRGIDADSDGRIDFRLAGASPRHRDLYVEADWVERPSGNGRFSSEPDPNAIPDVVAAFAAAPPSNPDGTTGIALHVDLGEAISMPIRAIIFKDRGPGPADDFDDFKLDRDNSPETGHKNCRGTFGTVAERASLTCAKVLAAKKLAYRYTWFADQFAEPLTDTRLVSGTSEAGSVAGGNDFLVTLGGFGQDAIKAGGGRRAMEAGTFMHEFGHTLGLAHGGRSATELDLTNCKPNYLSVMNYLMQTNTRFADTGYTRPLDYSRTPLPDLDETALDENVGLRGPDGQRSVYSLPGGGMQVLPATGAVDWNGSANPANPTGIDAGTVTANINNLPDLGPDCKSTTSMGAPVLETLHGRDDWANLHYDVEDSPDFADGVSRHIVSDELTADTILRMPAPDVRVTLSGPADVTAGGPIAVTASAVNAGPGNAAQVPLTISQPGPVTTTVEVGPLAPEATVTRAQTGTAPCTAADGSVLVSTASVAATGALGQPDLNPANDTASLTTTVHKPVPLLSVATAASGHAGEAITVTVTYRNAGTSAATGVLARVLLPKDVYYSTPHDPTGTPRPTTVTRRPDGTTELTWALPNLPANAPAGTIIVQVRPSLLMTPGSRLTLAGTLTTDAANGCPALTTDHSASTLITVPAAAGTPVATPIRSLVTASWTTETLARIQATDQRFDGVDGTVPDGGFGRAETRSVYGLNLSVQQRLRAELLTTYFNLGERKFNNNTVLRLQVISPILTTPATAGEAARQAQQLLDAPNFDTVAAAELLVVLVPLNSGLLT